MVVNLDKFRAIILDRKEAQAAHKLIIDNKEIKTTNSIKLLGTNIDHQLRFNEHISIPCFKAAMPLNAVSRRQKYMGKSEKEKEILCNINKPTMEIRRLRTLAAEIFKTVNEINPPYMKNIFTPKENAKVRQNDIIVKRINTSRFGTQRLRSLGPKIWNNLPSNIKSETSFLKFKELIKTWLGPKCRCKVCINM